MNSPGQPDPLESFVTRTLRGQPPRRAPHTLEARVLAELARRAALPWWRQSYMHWPAAIRGVFFVLSAAAATALVAGLFVLTRSTTTAQLAAHFAGVATAREVVLLLAEKALVLWRAIPPLWLYTALAIVAASYATLITAGTAAYRAFFAPTR